MYESYFQKVKDAARGMSSIGEKQSAAILHSLGRALLVDESIILEANKKDLDCMDEKDPRYDRLKLTNERLESIAADMDNVAGLEVPVGEVLEERELSNGLKLQKKRVPLGVIGVIYEARPNVTLDVFALCLRSGNACVLKGGSDATNSNAMLVKVIRKVLKEHGVNPDIIQLLPVDRLATGELLKAAGYVDVIIPRGSKGLIDYVRDNAQIPVIETGAGIVHTYFDKYGDLELGQQVVFNAKTRRVSVCNALDCLIIHRSRLNDLPVLVHPLAKKHVVIYADKEACQKLEGLYPAALLKKARDENYGTEFLSYKMSIKTVNSFDAALNHIYLYSSKHSEAIITENEERLVKFLNEVDAAVVYANASTAFTDGAQFGLGAEIGISTQKLHARGPMGLKELTSYKWIVRGEGHVRN